MAVAIGVGRQRGGHGTLRGGKEIKREDAGMEGIVSGKNVGCRKGAKKAGLGGRNY